MQPILMLCLVVPPLNTTLISQIKSKALDVSGFRKEREMIGDAGIAQASWASTGPQIEQTLTPKA
jgi:hypothetical protein